MGAPIVEIQQGKLQGDTATDLNGHPFFRFLGIPYAKPPVGELRFKVAEPAEPWSGIRSATKEGDSCIQFNQVILDFEGSENCLHLNVFIKELSKANCKLKPVMVYIHGGGFTMESNSIRVFGPNYLLTEDIVLVTINYRLGVLGFLSVEDTSLDIPGNNGLKDQVFALKWIQTNISAFGGDPKNVTIFGSSAGGASVHFHVLSPMSKGLFHKAIIQSGCALNPWSWGTRGNARIVAEMLGHQGLTEKEAVEILKQTPVEELFKAQLKISDAFAPANKRPFAPVIEEPNDTAFLTKEPLELIMASEYNKVPLIFGYNDREGIVLNYLEVFKIAPAVQIHEVIPRQMNIYPNSKEHEELLTEIKNFYNGPDPQDNYVQLVSDVMFVIQIMQSLKLHLKTGNVPIYLYVFTAISQLNIGKNLINMPEIKGVCHGDEIGYLFNGDYTPAIIPGSFEEKGAIRFVKLLTHFARTGNPTPSDELKVKWKPVESESNIDYLDFGEELVMGVNPDRERMEFWEKILEKYPLVFKN